MSTAKQRRAAAHRKLERQIAAREAAERQRRQQMIILSLVAAVAVIGLVTWMAVASNNNSETAAASASMSGSAAPASSGCGYLADGTGEPTVGLPSEDNLQTSGTVDLAVSTNRGDLTIQLDRSLAPCAVNSFDFLAQQGFFNNTICHRLVTGGLPVLQCGDPTGTGTGGPGYHFNEEPPTAADPYPEGTVAMANASAPGSTGSQFFICYGSCSSLPPNYSSVGKVTAGLDVVKAIAAEGTADGSTDGAPLNEVRINTLTPVAAG